MVSHGLGQQTLKWFCLISCFSQLIRNKKLDFTGQFSREPEVSVYDIHEGPDPLKEEATMEVKGNTLLVTRGWQKDYRDDKKRGSNIYCWFMHNSAKGFIDGHYTDYILPDLNSFLQTV
ncbi:Inter-alpha-trypsin inhibitor heavy chain H2 [Xenoophorus captivus]|uniref:Inter-alpha-trypsin inhibitor heavy chain H2 n=1 Tax=Xenoophorus captivus TaxID=1517983 RepID=A0ABV0R641_9TELE